MWRRLAAAEARLGGRRMAAKAWYAFNEGVFMDKQCLICENLT